MEENNQEYTLLKLGNYIIVKTNNQTITMNLNLLELFTNKYNFIDFYMCLFTIGFLLMSVIGFVGDFHFISFNNIKMIYYYESPQKIFVNFIKGLSLGILSLLIILCLLITRLIILFDFIYLFISLFISATICSYIERSII